MTEWGQMPPHDAGAECALLGDALLRGGVTLDDIDDLRPEDFFLESHRRIFGAMRDLRANSDPVGVTEVATWLNNRGLIQQVGGVQFLSDLLGNNAIVGPDRAAFYAKTIREKATQRAAIQTCQRAVAEGYAGVTDTGAWVEKIERDIHELCQVKRAETGCMLGPAVKEGIAKVVAHLKAGGGITGLSTGLHDLDRMISGLHRGDLFVLAARPGMGKTSLAMAFAIAVASAGHGVIVFSLEMPKEQLAMRAACTAASVSLSRIRSGQFNQMDITKLSAGGDTIRRLPIWIDDGPALSPSAMRSFIRRKQTEFDKAGTPLALVVVDYVQLRTDGGGPKNASREEIVSAITRSDKAAAKEFNVAWIDLAQLNRSLESRTDKRPMLSDLRESGAIEQDADIVEFIYRDEYYRPDTTAIGIAELITAKHRNGPTGTVCVAFDGEFTRFRDMTEDEARRAWLDQ